MVVQECSVASPDLTIIIPAYNEGERLATGFERLMRAGSEGRLDLAALELLYIDDGSSDDTATRAADLARRLPNAQVLRQKSNKGKGAAVRLGVATATAPKLIFTDADFAIDPRQIPSIVAALDLAPIAVGSRAVRGHVDYGSRARTVAGRGFNRLVRLLSAVDLRDTQCGFKGLRTAEAKLLFHLTKIDGFAFDVEILARASLLGWPVVVVPVSWSDVGGTHVKVARDSATMFLDLIRSRFSGRHMPALVGLENLGQTSSAEIAEVVQGTPLEAAPLVVLADGRRVLLAPLVPDDEALSSLRAASNIIGGTALSLPTIDLIGCTSIVTLTAPA